MPNDSSFFGMDVENIKKVAGSLEAEASHISSVLNILTSALQSVPWQGNDRENFVKAWEEIHAPAIRRAITDLSTTSGQVRSSIQLQISASKD